jgi:hypothetical protein
MGKQYRPRVKRARRTRYLERLRARRRAAMPASARTAQPKKKA